jgi:hypothetical protein
MAPDADLVPTFGQRSVVASSEYAIPFHLGYYAEIRRRMEAQIAAYYAASPAEVLEFADRYGVDLFLVNAEGFRFEKLDEMTSGADNARYEPFYTLAVRAYRAANGRYALLEAAGRCAVRVERDVSVVPTSCLRASG